VDQPILYRVTLPGARLHCSTPNEINKKASRPLFPWLSRALLSGEPCPLPLPATAGFEAAAVENSHGLVVTLYKRVNAVERTRVARIGIAFDKVSGHKLWMVMQRLSPSIFLEPPGVPWSLVSPEPAGIQRYPEIEEWLGDLADSIARIWLERKKIGPGNPEAATEVFTGWSGMAPAA
jgi:hypothetical protein